MTLKPGSRPVPDHPDYQLISKLGAGAFGEVWRTRAPGGMEVALKFIPLRSPDHAETELRSVELVRKLRHPNLVTTFSAWYDDGCLILAMELCDRTLADRLLETREQSVPGIPVDELFGYVRDAANAIDYLNAKHVQHRDVKPANMLLVGSGVKVGDFGIAKILERTASNTGCGTLGYMAPECFTGKLAEQSDQYSLAATYYHLRTGRNLYEGNQAEVMYAQLTSVPDLSCLPLAESAVLARALSKEPGERWRNCTVFINGLMEVVVRDREEQRLQKAKQKWREQEQRERAAEVSERKPPPKPAPIPTFVGVAAPSAQSQHWANQHPTKCEQTQKLSDPPAAFNWFAAFLICFAIGVYIAVDANLTGGVVIGGFCLFFARAAYRICPEIAWCEVQKCSIKDLAEARRTVTATMPATPQNGADELKRQVPLNAGRANNPGSSEATWKEGLQDLFDAAGVISVPFLAILIIVAWQDGLQKPGGYIALYVLLALSGRSAWRGLSGQYN